MKQVFLEKYQEYCNTKDKREELFKMVQRDDEILEDFVERILYNVQRAGQSNMGLDVLKIILLCGIREDFLDMLNLLGKGDISKESFENIVELCQLCELNHDTKEFPSLPQVKTVLKESTPDVEPTYFIA